jgi:hypothetical protein
MFATGSAALIVAARRRPSRALAGIAVVAAVAAAGVAIACWWGGRQLDSPLAVIAAEQGTVVPASVRAIVDDVNGHIIGDLRATAVSVALTPVVAATGIALAFAVPGLVRRHGLRRPGALLAASAFMAAVAVGSGTIPARPAAGAPLRCNGHVELCDRRYDQVVQAATHNAMSSPDVVAIWPEQDRGIRAQLDFGVRTLLVDTKYWHPSDPPTGLSKIERFIPARLVDAVFHPSTAPRRARPGTYLCHESCALGAIELTSALSQVREFLDDNPGEVVTLIIQNEVSATDTAKAFSAAGLDDHLYAHDPDEPWPTLGELVHDGHRLVTFSEVETPAPDWNHPAFRYMQDTPYAVSSPGELSCTRYRGEKTASLFLLNHWARRSAPDRADARVLNAREAIVSRARACAAERGQLPDFIAVDFFSLGDVMGAVDELNGLGPALP